MKILAKLTFLRKHALRNVDILHLLVYFGPILVNFSGQKWDFNFFSLSPIIKYMLCFASCKARTFSTIRCFSLNRTFVNPEQSINAAYHFGYNGNFMYSVCPFYNFYFGGFFFSNNGIFTVALCFTFISWNSIQTNYLFHLKTSCRDFNRPV